jgi:hypothetical protein
MAPENGNQLAGQCAYWDFGSLEVNALFVRGKSIERAARGIQETPH